VDLHADPKSIRSWLLIILLLLAIVGLLAAIATPNFVRGGPRKTSGIINKGTIMRFSTNGNDFVEYVLLGQESKPCKSLSELLAR